MELIEPTIRKKSNYERLVTKICLYICETTLIKTIKYEILQIVCHTDSDWDDVLLR